MSLETASLQKSFSVRMSGENISPEAVPVNDLVELLKHFQKLVKAYSQEKSLSPKEESSVTAQISLAEIKRGSAIYTIATDTYAINAITATSEAIQSGYYSDLPTDVLEELRGISEFGRKKHLSVELIHNEFSTETTVRLDADLLPQLPLISGTTTLFGICLRVGGMKPTAAIKPLSGGRTIYAQASEEIARRLAARLYEEVVLEGSAVWRSDTWEIKEFSISRLVPYQRQNLEQSFKELADASRGRWNDIDAADYVDGLRDEAIEE